MATLVTYLIKRSWREKADGSSTRSLLTSFHVGRIIYTDIRPATGRPEPVGAECFVWRGRTLQPSLALRPAIEVSGCD